MDDILNRCVGLPEEFRNKINKKKSKNLNINKDKEIFYRILL